VAWSLDSRSPRSSLSSFFLSLALFCCILAAFAASLNCFFGGSALTSAQGASAVPPSGCPCHVCCPSCCRRASQSAKSASTDASASALARWLPRSAMLTSTPDFRLSSPVRGSRCTRSAQRKTTVQRRGAHRAPALMGLCPRYFRSLRDSEIVQVWRRHGRLGRAGSWVTKALSTDRQGFGGWDLSRRWICGSAGSLATFCSSISTVDSLIIENARHVRTGILGDFRILS